MIKIEYVRRDKHDNTFSLYECDCGKQFVTRDTSVSSGATRSCGCLYKARADTNPNALKHGHKRKGKASPTYYSWTAMGSRCRNPKSIGFKYWGGRGIEVCPSWLIFENFLRDMGERPEGKSIDRIDNNLGYYKENCKWSTRKEQRQNRRYCKAVNNKLEFEVIEK